MHFILHRLGFYAVALWASITLHFLLPRLMPGNPIDYFISKYHHQLTNNPHALDSLRVMLGGTNDPLPLQYLHYLGNLAHGDFGVSYSFFPVRVSSIIASTLPWTLFLVGLASVLSFVLGTLIGALAAWRRGGAIDTLL